MVKISTFFFGTATGLDALAPKQNKSLLASAATGTCTHVGGGDLAWLQASAAVK